MRDATHYRTMMRRNHGAQVGFSLAAAAVYAAANGVCEAEHHGTDEWRQIARRLRAQYGETLDAGDVLAEMDRASAGNESLTTEQMLALVNERLATAGGEVISLRRMQAIAADRHKRYGIGRQINRGVWLFSAADIDLLVPRGRGQRFEDDAEE